MFFDKMKIAESLVA